MGIAGAGFGAAKSLEDIVAEQMLRQRLAAEIKQQEAALAERQRSSMADEGARTRQLDLQERGMTEAADERATNRREKNNQLGIRRMMGDFITQKEGPFTPDDQRGIAALQVEAGQVPNIDLPATPKPPGTHVVDGNLVDDTGKVLFTAPKTPTKPDKPGTHVVGGALVDDTGKVIYTDPNKAATNTATAEAADTAKEVRRIASALRQHPGRKGAFGLYESQMPTIRQDTADAETLLKSLQGLLTLENTGKLKGVLSNADMEVLRRASTTLDAKMSNPAADAELDRIVEVMGKVTGETPTPAVSHAPSSGPAIGERRMIHGVPAQWDGKGWLPVK